MYPNNYDNYHKLIVRYITNFYRGSYIVNGYIFITYQYDDDHKFIV